MALIKIGDFNGNDFLLYFKGTLLFLIPPEGKPEWVYYDGEADGPGQYLFRRTRTRSKDKKDFLVLDSTQLKKYSVDVKFPFGFFNTKESVILLSRTGYKQNLKGLKHAHSCQFFPIEGIVGDILKGPENAEIRTGLRWLADRVVFEPKLANGYFESPRYSSFQEALVQIRSRKFFARALSPYFAVTPHHANKDYLLFFHELVVAEIVSKENKIKVLVEDFKPELHTLLDSQGAMFV